MTIAKPHTPQPQFWYDAGKAHKRIESWAQVRNLCGDFYEQATAELFGAIRIATRGNYDYCPDLAMPTAIADYAEVKSVGNTGRIIVYQSRAAKDAALEAGGSRLVYVIWRHRTKTKDVQSVAQLYERLAASVVSCTIFSFARLNALLQTSAPRELNKQRTQAGKLLGYGDRSKGYGIGWDYPLAQISSVCDHRRLPGFVRVTTYGYLFAPFAIEWDTSIDIGAAIDARYL
jgi:hypothetical protein